MLGEGGVYVQLQTNKIRVYTVKKIFQVPNFTICARRNRRDGHNSDLSIKSTLLNSTYNTPIA